MSRDDLIAAMDDCLIAITDGKEIPEPRLRSLPPWRAVLIARVAVKAHAYRQEALDALTVEATRVGGNGSLGAPSGGGDK
jgi:hypothetical protein